MNDASSMMNIHQHAGAQTAISVIDIPASSSIRQQATSKNENAAMAKALSHPAVTLLRPQWLVVAALVALLSYATPQLLTAFQQFTPNDPPSTNKPYADLRSFRPRYQDDHQNETSVTLHVFGTSFVVLLLLAHPELIGSGVLALKCGQVACELLRYQDTGLVEGLIMLFVFFTSTRFLGGSTLAAFAATFFGYFCAWTGHFFFEGNRPATFIYPTYSLICDLVLWAETVTGITITM